MFVGSVETNRASRTGPLVWTNGGTVLVAPSSVASATCGLGRGLILLVGPGLVPPTAGSAWHMAQLLPLKVGPRPFPDSMVPDTDWTSLKVFSAVRNIACSLALRVGNALPAPAAPPRGPGSDWAWSIPVLRISVRHTASKCACFDILNFLTLGCVMFQFS